MWATNPYVFFVQIERALLREGLEADGALERPLPCARHDTPRHGSTRARGRGGQRNKTKPRWTNNPARRQAASKQAPRYHEGITSNLFVHQTSLSPTLI